MKRLLDCANWRGWGRTLITWKNALENVSSCIITRVLCSKRLLLIMMMCTQLTRADRGWFKWRCSVARGFVNHRDNDIICPVDSNGSRLVNCTWARNNISLIRFESLGSNLVMYWRSLNYAVEGLLSSNSSSSDIIQCVHWVYIAPAGTDNNWQSSSCEYQAWWESWDPL